MDLASGRVEELTSTRLSIPRDGWDSHPRYSPDGTEIVFARTGIGSFASGAVFVVEADGENLRQLSPATVNVRDPDWSPDGSQIVFFGRPRGGTGASNVQSNVYVVRQDGTDLRQLTSDDVSMGASWTDDGRILFVRIQIVNGVESADFWLMDADGQNQLPLTIAGEARECCSVGAAWQPIP
jgi:Tol biopolymer transport system component